MSSLVFQTIRYRLLLSYLAVLTVILGLFIIEVRITFARSLDQQLTDRLESLARAAALNLGIKEQQLGVDTADDALEVDAEEMLVSANQGIQWFDAEGTLLAEQGKYALKLPFNPEKAVQMQTTPYSAKGFTIPVNDIETGKFLGYTRVSESTQDLKETLRSLDVRLGGGVVMALALSAIGGIWLTRQAMQPIEKSFRQLQQFTADASHELRNPLMAIKSNAAVALKYAEGIRASDAKKFRAIASATTQMTALTEDLLLLARMDQAPTQPQNRANLTGLLEDLVQLYRAEAELKQIDLKAQILEHLAVCGDAVQLTRLFTNLIGNALRYTPQQGLIEIQTVHEGSQILVYVKDTGIGIAPDHLEQIFDRFWRADCSRTHGSGFGLGLAIAQGIAKQHGGSITVTSQLSVGSCFTVRLPAKTDCPKAPGQPSAAAP
jgi:two-component system, OmpR family, manganese sensing sensor histidine kinase